MLNTELNGRLVLQTISPKGNSVQQATETLCYLNHIVRQPDVIVGEEGRR